MTDSTPNEPAATPTPDVPPPREATPHKRSLVWMIVAGVAIVAAIGLGAWALVLNDDLNDTEAQLDAQTAAARVGLRRGRPSHRRCPRAHPDGARRCRQRRGRHRR